MLDQLVGCRLKEINDDGFSVIGLDGRLRKFEFDDDGGDCCGFNDISAKLLIDEKDMPVITKVVSVTESDDYKGESCKVTFFGVSKPIAEINTFSYSGSGWYYGATASVVCKETGESEVLSSW